MCRQMFKKTSSFRTSTNVKEDGDKSKNLIWGPWFVFTLSLVCYLTSLQCGLVFDDQPAILNNADIRPDTPFSNLIHNDFWGTPMHREESHKSYRPFCVLTFRLNYWVHELRPFGYHLINALLHSLVSILYYKFCSEFLLPTSTVVASSLFAVHPIHTEAVTGVVGRAELLSALFFLLSLRVYMKSTPSKEHTSFKTTLQCLLLAGLAMLSKEQGITAIAVCMTYDIFLVQKGAPPPLVPDRAPRGKIKGPTPTWRKDLVLRLLLMTSGIVFLLLGRMKVMGRRLPVFNKFDNPASVETWPIRHLTQHYLVSLNAWLLLFPSDLCCDWTMGTLPLVTSFIDPRVFTTLIFYAVICVILRKAKMNKSKNSIRIIISLSLCVFPFLPASNLFYPVGFVIAERVLYIPSMGFCMLVAIGWSILYRKCRKHRLLLKVFIVILLCLNVAKTIRRNFDWMDEETLFRSGLRVTQSNAKLYNNLGHVMEHKGKHDDALRLFLQAVHIQPDDLGSHLNVGRMYNALGRSQEAEKSFWMAKTLLPKVHPGEPYQTHLVPRHLDLFLNLGGLLSRNHSRLEEAQKLYQEAISMKTDYIDAYLQRASVLLKLNRSEEAHHMYKEALRHDHMNPDIFYNMGVLLLEQGKSVQALSKFDQALNIDPQHEKSLLNYAILSQDFGDSSLRKLAHQRLQVLLDKGSQPERTYFNLGILAMQDRDLIRAETYFKKALQLKGDFESALFNLGLTVVEGGRPLDALPYLQRLPQHHLKGMALLGSIYFNHLRNYSAAQRCYESILKLDPTNLPALHNLCASLFHLGHMNSAESCFMKAHTLAPQEPAIEQHLRVVQERRRTYQKVDTRHCPENGSTCTAKLKLFLEKDGYLSSSRKDVVS